MLWVSELPGARWPPCADVRLRWTRHLAFIYIYGCTSCVAAIFTRPWVKCTASEPRYTLSHTYTHTHTHTHTHIAYFCALFSSHSMAVAGFHELSFSSCLKVF